MALSFLPLQSSKLSSVRVFDFCGKIEGSEQQQEAREMALGGVRTAPRLWLGAQLFHSCRALTTKSRAVCLLEGERFGGISCAASPVGSCPASPSRLRLLLRAEGLPLAFRGAPFVPQPPSGKWRMSWFIACEGLCRLQSLDLQCHRVVQKLQVMFGRF